MFFTKKAVAEAITPMTPSADKSIIDKLTHENARLRNQREELQMLYDSNRLTLEELDGDLESKTQECTELRNCTRMLNDELLEAEASGKKAVGDVQASIRTLELKFEQAKAERDEARTKFEQLRTTTNNQLHNSDETIDACNDRMKALYIDKCKLQQQLDRAIFEVQTLKAQRNGANELQAKLVTLQEKLDFTNGCNQVLKRSLRAKEEEVADLEKQLHTHRDTDHTDSLPSVDAQEKLPDAQAQVVELQRTIQDKQDLSLMHDAEMSDLTASLKKLQQALDQLLCDKSDLSQQIKAHQRENDDLAARIASAETTTAKCKSIARSFSQQFQAFSKATADKATQHQAQVDAMYAQQNQTSQRFEAQLHAKASTIHNLESKLKQSDIDTVKAVTVRDDQIAGLKEQLRRLALDRDSEIGKADDWQDYANEQQADANARIAALEAENTQLKAQVQLQIRVAPQDQLDIVPAVCLPWCSGVTCSSRM
jgi:chromosome segregation ATPase